MDVPPNLNYAIEILLKLVFRIFNYTNCICHRVRKGVERNEFESPEMVIIETAKFYEFFVRLAFFLFSSLRFVRKRDADVFETWQSRVRRTLDKEHRA